MGVPRHELTIHPRLSLPVRTDPAVASIAKAWRTLTSGRTSHSGRRLGPGEPTLIACSGGADSSALAIAMRAVTDRIVLAHVVHDMRPRAEALADRDAVRALAELLGVPFVEAEVSVRHAPADAASEHAKHLGANIEQVARVRRYEALARLALDAGIHFVATAHHAQDQLETLLMRLMRGAGPQGMRGIAPRRPLHPTSLPTSPAASADERAVWLIRPMLGISRADTERLCSESGWSWRDDATNLDTSRVRAAVRQRVVPALLSIAPNADLRAAQTSGMLREIADIAFAAARRLDRRSRVEATACELSWRRKPLRRASPVVLGMLLRRAIEQFRQPSPASTQSHTRPGTDRLSYSLMQHLTDAIKDDSPDPRRFTLRGIQIEVTSREVHIRLTPLHAATPHPTLAAHVKPADSSALSVPSTP